MKKKILASFLTIVFLLSIISLPTIKANATQSKSGNFYPVNLTGNGPTDMVAIATAQAGRSQASMGYTEAWCADFVCDCAKIAGQTSAIPAYGGCRGLYNRVLNAGGYVVSTPQAGDLVFYYCTIEEKYMHVGIMKSANLSVHGNYTGIVSNDFNPQKFADGKHTVGKGVNIIYVRPNYRNADVTPPTISNVRVSDVSENGYTVTCTVTDNVGVAKVAFPTWTINNDQDDIQSDWMNTALGTISGDGTVTYRVNTSEHNYENDSWYLTHIYAWDTAGNRSSVSQDHYPALLVWVSWKGSEWKYTTGTLADGDYIIACAADYNKSQYYYLDIEGAESPAPGGRNVNLWQSTTEKLPDCDVWTVKKLSNGYYSITQKGTNMALEAESDINGCNIRVNSFNSSMNQQWDLYGYPSSKIEIICRCNSRPASAGQMSAGANISAVYTNNDLQKWYFIPVNKPLTLDRTKITEISNTRHLTMTVKYKPVKKRLGYQIEYATNSKFNNKTRVNTGATSKDIGKLTKGNIYFVRVRAYARDDTGKLVYSKWSPTQKVKIKK